MSRIINNFDISAIFKFNKKVVYNNVSAQEHSYNGKNFSCDFNFKSDDDFQLIDIVVNGNSVKEHIEKSVDFFDFKQFLNQQSFYKTQKNLTLNIHELDWICVVGPFSKLKVASVPESGDSNTFYYITWFGHARPGTNIEITGKQVITHNQPILDKWIMQKKMWGIIGESRARVFFVPPFEYKD
tara:strand:- start:35 stop:586 length:552 start_codon:yes stop_codon:yes gene_type:complete